MAKQKQKKGFTLIELVIVLAVVTVIFGISFETFSRSQSQQLFNNTFEKIVSMISSARSLAITGKGQLDYTDFDHDGCRNTSGEGCNGPDYVTPANYGVAFVENGRTHNNFIIKMFADNHPPATELTGSAGKYDTGTDYAAGQDLVLAEMPIPKQMQVVITPPFSASLQQETGSILFSPNYADISLDQLTWDNNSFLTIQLKGVNPARCRQIKLHRLAGVPEVGFCPQEK